MKCPSLTYWQVFLSAENAKNFSNHLEYVLEISFPTFFDSKKSAKNFAQNKITSLSYDPDLQSCDKILSIIDIDRDDWEHNLPYFVLQVTINGRIRESEIGNQHINICRLLDNNLLKKSDISLLEYVSKLKCKSIFKKVGVWQSL